MDLSIMAGSCRSHTNTNEATFGSSSDETIWLLVALSVEQPRAATA